MVTNVEGFKLEVTSADSVPHVRVSLKSGAVVVDTDKVSVTGLQRLSAVFEAAAGIAARQLERPARTA